jgi:hypothetical protein
MSDAYKVRLEDGNEYGPVDADTLRLWYDEGRISKKTLVLRPEGAWSMLSEVLGLGAPPPEAAPAANPANPTSPANPATPVPAPGDARPPRPAGQSRSGAPRPRPQPAPQPAGPPIAAFALGFILLLALVAAGGWWVIGRRTAVSSEDLIKEQASPDRRFSDPGLGVSLQAPDGWVILRKGNPFVLVSNTLVPLAHPRTGGFAVLTMDSVPKRRGLDEALDAQMESRRVTSPGIVEEGRADVTVSGQPGRHTAATWSADGSRVRGEITAWQDAWNYFTLSGWAPESAEFGKAFQALQGAITATPVITARIQQAVPRVVEEAPQLSPGAAEILVRAVLSRGGSPESVAQEAFYAAHRGRDALSIEEAKEMGKILNEQVYKPIPKDQRGQLASFLERVNAGRSSQPEDDQAMRDQIKAGVLALPEDARARLQELWEKTVAAAVRPS